MRNQDVEFVKGMLAVAGFFGLAAYTASVISYFNRTTTKGDLSGQIVAFLIGVVTVVAIAFKLYQIGTETHADEDAMSPAEYFIALEFFLLITIAVARIGRMVGHMPPKSADQVLPLYRTTISPSRSGDIPDSDAKIISTRTLSFNN
jgi:hypothetical protein